MKHNSKLNEMMNDAILDFVDIPKILEILGNDLTYNYFLIVRNL
jgi:hypothetical protein